MPGKIDKRARSEAFRDRLQQAMGAAGLNRSQLAREVGVDRSTVSQLLAGDGKRLPNAHVVGACAEALGVSTDWLLSLSDRAESAEPLLASGLTLTEAPRALVDEQIFRWHRESEGYKIRHVPAALPDMFKTRALLEWEYAPHLGRTAEQAIGAAEDRLDWMRSAASDYEIAVPIYELDSFAGGTGYYSGLPAALRREQLTRLIELTSQLYPRLRLYVFDARRLYSAPVTIFGPQLCVIYIGAHYLAFRDRDRIEIFTRHFDTLVREAAFTAREAAAHLARLRDQVR